MDIGMLWFDDGPRPIDDKVERASSYYAGKYGRTPTVCLIHPTTLNGGERAVAGVQLRAAASVLPDHFWIGEEDQAADRSPSSRKAA
jgi:hypothetical protein